MGYHKGWNSERVPPPANSSRKYIASGAMPPFNAGRALPSKWEDAEKWICSPVSGPSLPTPHYRRPKSKSGPLGSPVGIRGAHSLASPQIPCFDGGRVGSFAAGSPFMSGVLVTNRGCCDSYSSTGSGGGGNGDVVGVRRSSSANEDSYVVRSASINGWSDALIESSSSLPSSQGTLHDEKLDNIRESAIKICTVALRKDVATQMSPNRSTHSCSSSSSAQPVQELESHFSKIEVRDVEVDDRVTVTRWSKKHMARGSDKRSSDIIGWKKRSLVAKASCWGVAETTNFLSKYKREEAKITAWENLQKAKAEAAMRKLEMELEKKRSSSMDKILNKLRYAQRKAQDMRTSLNSNQSHQVARSTNKLSYFGKTGEISSLSGCFTCHAF